MGDVNNNKSVSIRTDIFAVTYRLRRAAASGDRTTFREVCVARTGGWQEK